MAVGAAREIPLLGSFSHRRRGGGVGTAKHNAQVKLKVLEISGSETKECSNPLGFITFKRCLQFCALAIACYLIHDFES